MALKTAGVILLAGSGAIIGLAERGRVYRRARSLKGFQGALSRIHSEISYARPEPAEIFGRLSREQGGIGNFFKTVGEGLAGETKDLVRAFETALERHSGSLCINQTEAEELLELARDMGTMDIEGALASVSRAGEVFRAKSGEAEAAKKNEGRLRFTLWLSAAALLALLLI